MKFGLVRVILVLAALLLGNSYANAQISTVSSASSSEETAVKLPEKLTPETVRDLVSGLSDQQVRSLLLERLDAVAKERAEAESGEKMGVVDFFGFWAKGIVTSVTLAVERIPLIGEGFAKVYQNWTHEYDLRDTLTFVGIILAAIVAGLFAEYIVKILTHNKRANFQNIKETDTLFQTMRRLAIRLFWELIALIVFFTVTRNIIVNALDSDIAPFAEIFMVNMVVIPRLTAAFLRFLLAPNQPAARLVHASDKTAKTWFYHTIGIMLLSGFTVFIIDFNARNGVAVGSTRLGFWLTLIFYVWLIYAVLITREGITKLLEGARPEEVTPAEQKVARFFPWFSVWFIVIMWCVTQLVVQFGRFDLLQSGAPIITLGLVTFAPLLDTAIRGLVRHLVPPMQGTGVVATRAYHSTKRSYIRIGRVLVFAAILIIIADAWQMDFTNLASAGLGVQFAGRFLEVLMVLAIGYLIWEVVTLLINRKLAAELTAAGFDLNDDEPGGGEGGGAGGSRLSTVLPMIRFMLQIAIAALTVLLALANMGVDITPLLAGAGILGIAIGFGAQTLVRDVVAGLFFLFEDAFRVGEYLTVNDTVGTVEKISLRSLQLRHHNGPVHTIPFGEIPKVTNQSRDWMIMKLKWTLPFGTDINKIKKLFKEIGKEMMEADYAPNIIQTFKSQGVYDVDDVGIVMRGKFMAKPGTQWLIRKDVFARVQKKLEENGIEFARREVRVNVPGLDDSKNLDENSKKAITAAATQAAQQEEVPAKPAPDTP